MHDLELIADEVMKEKGLLPDYSTQVQQQLGKINKPAHPKECEDLSAFLWCSIDNDDSLDLDQLTYAERHRNGWILWVAVADVDSLVNKDTPIDQHARTNTTSVYTPAKIYSMLPVKLSTNLTSLNENEDRAAMVVQVHVSQEGQVVDGKIVQAIVRNKAKLNYNEVGAWLEGKAVPEKLQKVHGLESTLKTQHEAAQTLKKRRHELGALTLQSSEVEAKVMDGEGIVLKLPVPNYANELIEHFMIAANMIMAQSFRAAKIASLRRVVKVPKSWDRIIQVAYTYGYRLPDDPDSNALDDFLIRMKKEDPETFPDLSLTIIKLLGRGEYIVEAPGSEPVGHFGLALSEYTHSTAPNRRFPDMISQRQFKAFLQGRISPYGFKELQSLADHCTEQEDAAKKVERHMNKSAAALLLFDQIGKVYSGIVTGAGDKGTFVRVLNPPVEGKVVKGGKKLDVGDRVKVRLLSVNVPMGFIDFALAT